MFAGRLELQPFTGKVFGQPSFLKLGGDVLNSRDEAGVNISQSSNLLVNNDGSLSPFVLPSADERTAWSVDAWLELGPFDLIGEYLQEHVEGRTVNGVPPTFANFTTDGFYVTGAYFLDSEEAAGCSSMAVSKSRTKGERRALFDPGRPQLLHPRRRSQADGQLYSYVVGFPPSQS